MPIVKYQLVFKKSSYRIQIDDFKAFLNQIFKEFGGLALLSNLSFNILENSNVVEIRADDENIHSACSALLYCGSYKDIPCRFSEIK